MSISTQSPSSESITGSAFLDQAPLKDVVAFRQGRTGRRIVAVIADVVIYYAIALAVRQLMPAFFVVPYDIEQIVAVGLILFVVLHVFDLYNLDSQISGLRAPPRAIVANLITIGLSLPVAYVLKRHLQTNWSVYFGPCISLGIFGAWATSSRLVAGRLFKERATKLHWLAIGKTESLRLFLNDFAKKENQGTVHCLVPDSERATAEAAEISLIAKWSELPNLLERKWTGIIICDSLSFEESLFNRLMMTRLQGAKILDLTEFYEHIWFKVPVFYLRDGWFALSPGFDLLHNPIGLRIKRIIDVLLASTLLVLTTPIMAIAAVLIKLTSPGPIVYRQVRTGLGGKNFIIYKFRSMVGDAEKNGAQWAQKNDSRITPIGQFLRISRIDELPQLINVLKGEMSFIGPRPERPEMNAELEKVIQYYNLRHLVPPGITGWAQCLYGYGSSVEDSREKLQYDLYYIKNYSLLIDVAILLKTVRVVLFGRGR
ncbi:MAG: sugar transferase [Bdellovibrionaceae bacterium]|nr:sugar transferase [Pseudobdellovibrionaceae bacterium]